MTYLVISIVHKGGVRYEVKSDNLRREDATGPEIEMANNIEMIINETLKAAASKIIHNTVNQSGPGASDGN